MKIEVELKGFTPLLDVLIEKFGLVTAAIYGVIWRYAQMEDKVCRASLEKIGQRVSVSAKTVERHVKKLCEDDYLNDLTPDIKHKPHIYVITSKAQIKGLMEAKIEGQTESLTRSDRESYQGQTESPIKKETNKETKEEKEPSPNFSDPLTHIVSFAKSHQPGQEALSEPADYEKFWGTRDDTLKLYNQKMGRAPGQLKDQYIQFVQQHVTGDDDLAALAASFDAALLNWGGSGSPPLARIFEIYQHGRGDYEKFRAWKWPEAAATEGTNGLGRSDDERARLKQKLAERNGGHGKTNER